MQTVIQWKHSCTLTAEYQSKHMQLVCLPFLLFSLASVAEGLGGGGLVGGGGGMGPEDFATASSLVNTAIDDVGSTCRSSI